MDPKLASLLVIPLTYVAWSLFSLARNYTIAREIGVPLIVLPISPLNPIWMLVEKFFIPILRMLPFGSGNFTRYQRLGWEFDDRSKTHEELGDAYMAVTPGKNWLYICDHEAISDLLHRRNEFKRPLEILDMLNVFGPNVSTVEDQAWLRHRRFTAPPFNENNNSLVWIESLSQARQMMEYWEAKKTVTTLAQDAKTFSLHVLSSAGFGKSYPFDSSSDTVRGEHSNTYKESLFLILENAILILVLGPKLLSNRFLQMIIPSHWVRVGQATVDYKAYMAEIIEEEKNMQAQGRQSRDNLMTALIKSSSEAEKGKSLTEAEIFGNMFVFNFAGHDTTANTLAYAFILLAAHPNLETVRLYDPLLAFTKSTGTTARSLKVGSNQILIPANTMVLPSLLAVQSHPRYWGPDPVAWRPSRWIISSPKHTHDFEGETFYTPPKGSYIPWSDGGRACPGKTFAQVEFVAAMAALFRDHFVEPEVNGGETMESALKRMEDVIADSGMVLLLQMLRPERAGVCWKRL
ncbi:hypothetical protein MMC22_000587 [Lobaria immixta]|nr:hypothetical protein [Lobaria immixta]